jgi:hypothetical protein
MSAGAIHAPVVAGRWPLWRSQILTILLHDLRNNFITKRGFWIYLLALAPVALVWMHSIVAMQRGTRHDLMDDTRVLATIFHLFLLRPAIFFGCVGIFVNLFRGEVVQKSLHYYLLAPVRREVLVSAKYLSGLITAVFFFGGSVTLTFFGMFAHASEAEWQQYVTDGNGWQHLAAYVGITALACMAWGAIMTWVGIRWKNPVLPAVLLLFWETFHAFVPWWARKLSVLHYLQSLTPAGIEFRRGPGVLLGQTVDPEPVWFAVTALIALTAGALALAMYQLRRTEISYSTD